MPNVNGLPAVTLGAFPSARKKVLDSKAMDTELPAPHDEDDRLLLQRFQALAATLEPLREKLDHAAYARAGLDPTQPVVGLGPRDAPLCFFGRDPGTEELRLRQPFVGAAGRLLRSRLLAVAGVPPGDAGDEALLRAGAPFYWLNVVPYKPHANDPWPAPVRHAFRPLVLHCLLSRWDGQVVVALGEQAFDWFAVGQPAEVQQRWRARWARVLDPEAGPERVRLEAEGRQRVFEVYPLPHPSPRNVKGRQGFAALLDGCLQRVLGTPGAGDPQSPTDHRHRAPPHI